MWDIVERENFLLKRADVFMDAGVRKVVRGVGFLPGVHRKLR